jgi:Tol biopolymer transport system component
MSPLRYPPVAGGQIRIEGYLVPRVTSWPAYPSWSPDGRSIAFSMDGRIWTVPAEGGTAVQITRGEGYDFEPDWSPDGTSIAFSRDVEANLDVYVVSLPDGAVRRLTRDPALEFHPRWSSDGTIVYTSALSGNFDVYRVSPDGGVPSPVVAWPTNEIQPDPTPDGEVLFVSSRSGRIGTGGIFLGEREVHFEETAFRARPALSPDGKTIAYVSDAGGVRGIWLLPSQGGVPIPLTRDRDADAFQPAWSPDGERIAYVSNRGGAGALEIAFLHGGSVRRVPVTARRAAEPRGALEVHLSHPARVSIVGSDGRYHAPPGAFRRITSFTEVHYFHAAGSFSLDVPRGRTEIHVSRGPELVPTVKIVDVGEGARVSIAFERFFDGPAQGLYSGDTHVHDLHGGDVLLTPEALVAQAEAEDVHVVNALIHVDGTKLMGDLSRFVPGPHPASTKDVLLRYGQEYRMSFGHRAVLSGERIFLPLTSAVPETARPSPFPPLFEYLKRLRAEDPGVLVGVPHPYFGDLARGEMPRGAPSEIPVNVALGLVDYFDVNCIWSDERGSAAIYWKLLNSGFRLPASGGSDTFSDLSRDPPLGTGRTYVAIDGPFSLDAWFEGLRRGRSFSTNGPLLELDVEGRSMGEELSLGSGREVSVVAVARSVVPMTELHVLVNGERFATVEGEREIRWSGRIPVEESSWIAVEAEGPSSPWITDTYLYAHSTPVWVTVAGRPVLVEKDRAYLERYVEALIAYAESETSYRSESERAITLGGFREARDRLRALRR